MMSTPKRATTSRIMTRSQRKKAEVDASRMRVEEFNDEENTEVYKSPDKKSNQRKTPRKQPKERQQRVLRSLQVEMNGEPLIDNKKPLTRSALKKKLTKQEKAVAFERARLLMRSTTPAKTAKKKENDENDFMNIIKNEEQKKSITSDEEHIVQEESSKTEVQQGFQQGETREGEDLHRQGEDLRQDEEVIKRLEEENQGEEEGVAVLQQEEKEKYQEKGKYEEETEDYCVVNESTEVPKNFSSSKKKFAMILFAFSTLVIAFLGFVLSNNTNFFSTLDGTMIGISSSNVEISIREKNFPLGNRSQSIADTFDEIIGEKHSLSNCDIAE